MTSSLVKKVLGTLAIRLPFAENNAGSRAVDAEEGGSAAATTGAEGGVGFTVCGVDWGAGAEERVDGPAWGGAGVASAG